MELDEKNRLTIDELHGIIKGLMLDSFASVEPNALVEIKAMIKFLPTPEALGKLADNPGNIEKIQSDIGKIMRLIELYSKRDVEYKTRYKARTKLEPRYKVLKCETPIPTLAKNNLIKNLVKLSQVMDDEDYGGLSQEFLNCAKSINNDEIPIEQLYYASKIILQNNNSLIKTAQLTDINLDFSGITNGLQQISAWFESVKKEIISKYGYLKNNAKTKIYVNDLENIWNQVNVIADSTSERFNKIEQTTSKIQNEMKKLIPSRVIINNEPADIVWEKDPRGKGYERAVVYNQGKKYLVQEDNTGKKSFKEVKPTQPRQKKELEQPQPQQPEQPQPVNITNAFENFKNGKATLKELRAINDYIENKKKVTKIDYKDLAHAFNLNRYVTAQTNYAELIDAVVNNKANRRQLEQLQEQVKQQIKNVSNASRIPLSSPLPEHKEEPKEGPKEEEQKQAEPTQPVQETVEPTQEPNPELEQFKEPVVKEPIPEEPTMPEIWDWPTYGADSKQTDYLYKIKERKAKSGNNETFFKFIKKERGGLQSLINVANSTLNLSKKQLAKKEDYSMKLEVVNSVIEAIKSYLEKVKTHDEWQEQYGRQLARAFNLAKHKVS